MDSDETRDSGSRKELRWRGNDRMPEGLGHEHANAN